MNRDLAVFTEDNDHWRSERRRVPWPDRVELIKKKFPDALDADWNVVLRDDDVFARLLKDILKVDQIEAGRSGPRPNLDFDRGIQTWKEMTGRDFSEQPFQPTFRLLTRMNSLSAVARKTTISRSRVHRLLQGEEHPTVEDMRLIAVGYGKKPAYFAEYRAEYIMAAMAARFAHDAEMTITLYTKLARL